MSQSLAKIYIHLIFSTKNRERCIPYNIGVEFHGDMGGTLNGLGCSPFVMARTESISDVVGQIKKSANDWLRNRDQQFKNFYWQGGYGVFSVSQSAVEEVRQYIRNQREHHKKVSFQDEYRAFLKRYEIEFDERYVWD
jgi:putative transposase